MSLAIFESYLEFAEGVMRQRTSIPTGIDVVELESALVSHGVVLLHSHMEQCMRRSVDLRCGRCSDAEIRTFALAARKETTGKLKIEALKGTLTRFSDAYKSTFSELLNRSGIGTSWDSVVIHRHTVAHEGQPAGLTLADLRLFYDHIREVLGFFCEGLGLDPAECVRVSDKIVPARSNAAASAGIAGAAPPTGGAPSQQAASDANGSPVEPIS